MHLQSNETILKVVRHHKFPFIMHAIALILLLAPFYILLTFTGDLIPSNILIPLKLILVIISGLIVIYSILVYFLDKIIITNKRVVHEDWQTLIKKEIQLVDLKDIESIIIETQGILSKIPFLNFGDMDIQSSSNFRKIHFIDTPNPYKLEEFINNVIQKNGHH